MKPLGSNRGSILVESALVVSVALMLILASIDLGIIGFFQESSDGAAFVYGRLTSVGIAPSSGSAAQVTSGIFPQLPISSFTNSATPAPVPTMAVDYLYNGTASEQSSASTNRHGGFSSISQQSLAAQVNKSNVATIMGLPIETKAQSSEAYNRECGQHFNISGSNEACGSKTAPTNYDIDFLKQGENVAPYYMGFNYMWYCGPNAPWVSQSCQYTPTINDMGVASALYNHQVTGAEIPSQSDGSNNLPAAGVAGDLGTSSESSLIAFSCTSRDLLYMAGWFQLYPTMGDAYRDFFNSGTNPAKTYFNADTTFLGNSQHYGIGYAITSPSNTAAVFVYETYLNSQFNQSVQRLYRKDYREIKTGYAINSYSGPGAYPLANRYQCNAAPRFPYAY